MRSSWFAVVAFGITIGLLVGCSRAEDIRGSGTADHPQMAETDWPWWRGPERNGYAPRSANPPQKWSDTEGVVWKAPVPGRGHGSAIVVGNRVLLTAAEHDSETQSVLCFDRDTGEQLWKTAVHRGGFETKGHQKSSLASTTPASDGSRVFVNFLNGGAVHTTALDLDGNLLWQTKITDYVVHQGYGSSPAIYGSLVIVSADNKSGGAIAGLDRATGEIVWRRQRPALPNYPSPIIVHAAGRDQLIMTGCDRITSLDPLTGAELWEVSGATTECVTSTVTDGERVFSTGGYPKSHVSAVLADGSGKLAWENNSRVYVPSMLERDGYLYAIMDGGIAVCWESATGKEVWKGRLEGTFSSSPVLVGDVVFATNESGRTFLFRANPEGFEQLGQNQLGDEVYSTPAISGDKIYLRVAHYEADQRQEMLYCLGTAK